jgi:uncharacterized membrane protein
LPDWPPDPPQSFTQFITTVFDTPQGWKLIEFGTGIGFVFAVLGLKRERRLLPDASRPPNRR